MESSSTELGVVTKATLGGFRPSPVTGTGAEPWVLDCTWFQLSDDELGPYLEGTGGVAGRPAPASPTPATPTSGDPTEWSIVHCGGIGTLNYWPTGDPPPPNIIDWLIARARASVAFPIPVGQAAPFGDQDAPLITQLETWLWIDQTIWAPITATPPPVFGYTATATATPTNVTFTSQDRTGNHRGATINCGANLGPPYNFNLHAKHQHSDCTLNYRHDSTVADWTLTTTMTWAITWTCTPGCGSGTLPDQQITTTRDVLVTELQAIAVPTRP